MVRRPERRGGQGGAGDRRSVVVDNRSRAAGRLRPWHPLGIRDGQQHLRRPERCRSRRRLRDSQRIAIRIERTVVDRGIGVTTGIGRDSGGALRLGDRHLVRDRAWPETATRQLQRGSWPPSPRPWFTSFTLTTNRWEAGSVNPKLTKPPATLADARIGQVIGRQIGRIEARRIRCCEERRVRPAGVLAAEAVMHAGTAEHESIV
mgnify:CR=1 FL=1